MDLLTICFLTFVCVALVFAGVLVSRMFAYSGRRYQFFKDAAFEDAGEFSSDRYLPMARLLSEEDFRFLEAQPGYRPEIGARLRLERRRIFRQYLRDLAQDFHSLHAQARQMVANAPEEHAELVGVLMRQKLVFWRAMLGVELRLLTGGGRINVRALVESIEAMRADLAKFDLAGVQAG